MRYREQREQLLAYLRGLHKSRQPVTPKDSPQIAKATKIKSSVVGAVLGDLRNEGLVTYSRSDGWRLK